MCEGWSRRKGTVAWESWVVCVRGIVHVRGRVGCMREGWNSVGVGGCVCE